MYSKSSLNCGDFKLTEDSRNNKFEIHFNNDETYSVSVKLDSLETAFDAAMQAKRISKMIGLSSCIEKLRLVSNQDGELLIFPKPEGVSDEVRLTACAALAYPDGFPQEAIKTKLDIGDTSRDSYINWDTKESSKYLSYNPSTKKVYVSAEGIEWVCNQLKTRGVIVF